MRHLGIWALCFVFVFIFNGLAFGASNILLINAIEVESFFNSPTDRGVYLYLNDNINVDQVKKHLRIRPSVGFFNVRSQYKAKKNCYKITGAFKANQSYVLELTPGQLINGKQRFAENKIEFKAKGAEPSLEFVTNNSVIELKSRQLLPISYTNISDFKFEITQLPAIMAPALEAFFIFTDADEEAPSTTENIKYLRDFNSPKNLTSKAFQELIGQTKDYINQLKSDKFSELKNELNPYLKGSFNRASKGYLGSKGLETEEFYSLSLDIREKPEQGGSYYLSLKSEGETAGAGAVEALKLIQITDLAITYKLSANELLLWITSMETGKPIEGAEILVTTKDHRYIFPGKTGKDGILIVKHGESYKQLALEERAFKYSKEPIELSKIVAASAATAQDSSFVSLASNRLYPNNVTQVAIEKAKAAQAGSQVFCERGVYRPGERVYWKAIFREFVNGYISAPAGASIEVVVKNSRNEELYNETHQLNEFGSYSGNLELSSFANLGQYRIEAWLKGAEGAERAGVCMNSFQVQEFEPPRHFVDIQIKEEKKLVKHMVGQEKQIKIAKALISGKYYAGGKVKHAKVQWSASLVGHTTPMTGHDGYWFGNGESEKLLIESGNSVLDKNGSLELELPLNQSILTGLNGLEITATVVDVDGKAATSMQSFTVDTGFKVGISEVLGPDSEQQSLIKAVAVDRNGNKLSGGGFSLELMFNRWFYTRKRAADGSIYYSWSQGWLRSSLLTQEAAGGEAVFKLTLLPNESYMARVSYENGEHKASSAKPISLPGSLSSYTDYNSQHRSNSGNHLVLIPDKHNARLRDRVNIKYSLPHPAAYGLITCENDSIINARVVRLDKAYGEFTETIVSGCEPDVYISLTVPSLRNDFPSYSGEIDKDYPRTCYGYTKISIKPGEAELRLEIEPKQNQILRAAPGENVQLEFFTRSVAGQPIATELAVCVVDESILALTGFVTPRINLLQQFIKPLSVFTGDLRVSLIGQNLSRLIQTRALTGGGEGTGDITSEDALRKDFRPVAYWNGALKTDEKGRAAIEFKAPDTMTTYRVYGVAMDKHTGFTSAERGLIVSKEFYVEPGLPAFLTKGDVAHIALAVHNQTDKAAEVKLSIESAQNLAARLKTEQIKVESKSVEAVRATIIADVSAEEAKLQIKGQLNGLTDRIERSLPINSEHLMLNRQASGAFTNKQNISLELPNWLENEELKAELKGRLTLSTGLWARLAPSLKYLMRYPYGCLEQVSSGLMPLAALRTLASQQSFMGYSEADYDKFIAKGLENIYRLQLGTGGFAYWPSMNTESWWSTQYAVFALSLLQKSGYPVDKDRLERALGYVRTRLFKGVSSDYEQSIYALSLVNLAMHKKLSSADLQRVIKGFDQSNEEVATLIMWAQFLSGEVPYDAMGATIKTLKPSKAAVSKGWYSSSVRTDAFKLLVSLCEASEGSKSISSTLAGSLIERLNSTGYYNSTADTGIALFALSEYIKANEANLESKEAEVTIAFEGNEQSYKISPIGTELTLSKEQLTKGFSLAGTDNSLVHWSLNYEYPANPKQEDKVTDGFTIYKEYENISGEKTIRVGDVVRVSLVFEDKFVEEDGWQRLSNIAVEDSIPAGFTPINSALKNDVLPSGIDDDEERYYYENHDGSYDFYPTHSEIKKDKFLAFKTQGWSGRFKLSYYLRASCPGVYKTKPAQISLMYAPEIHGRSSASTIIIEE